MTKRYDKYKDSDIEWLGEIPSHWEINKLKRAVIKNQRGITPKYVDEEKSTENPILNQACIYTNHIKFERVKYNLEASNKNIKGKVLNKDILICSTGGGTAGRVGFFDSTLDNYVVDSHVSIVRTNDLYISRFFYYLLNTITFGGQIKGCIKGATNQEELSNSRLNEIKTIKLSKEEQQIIADYLDQKTSKIDSAVAELEKQKSLLIELKKSTIHQAVTKGLDLTVPMKDSGVEWIGEVPESWEHSNIKSIFNERTERNLTGETHKTNNLLSLMKDIGVINYKDKGNVGNKSSDDITKYKVIYKDDIVFNKMNAKIGSLGKSNEEIGAASVVYIIMYLKNTLKFNVEYFEYLFKDKNFQKTLRQISTGILEIRESFNLELFKQLSLFLPTKAEQDLIANHLKIKIGQIDQSIEVIDNQIAKMKEYKKTLINDVVTGKIKVV